MPSAIIDDLSREGPATPWRLFTDRVMGGGVSKGSMARETIGGRVRPIRMRGNVSLDNNGDFVQIALDLAPQQGTADLSQAGAASRSTPSTNGASPTKRACASMC